MKITTQSINDTKNTNSILLLYLTGRPSSQVAFLKQYFPGGFSNNLSLGAFFGEGEKGGVNNSTQPPGCWAVQPISECHVNSHSNIPSKKFNHEVLATKYDVIFDFTGFNKFPVFMRFDLRIHPEYIREDLFYQDPQKKFKNHTLRFHMKFFEAIFFNPFYFL